MPPINPATAGRRLSALEGPDTGGASEVSGAPGAAGKLVIGAAIAVALALVTLVVAVGGGRRAARDGDTPAHPVSMADSAQAMQRAGAAMQAHGRAMIDAGRQTGDQDRVAHGERWTTDGQALAQGGGWMAMSATKPGDLLTVPDALAARGSWSALARTSAAMLHDPTRARNVDLEALRWNGEAMQAEGRNMAEHGRLMGAEVAPMTVRYGLDAHAAADLDDGARAMLAVGTHLAQTGQAMVDYADRLRRSIGYR